MCGRTSLAANRVPQARGKLLIAPEHRVALCGNAYVVGQLRVPIFDRARNLEFRRQPSSRTRSEDGGGEMKRTYAVLIGFLAISLCVTISDARAQNVIQADFVGGGAACPRQDQGESEPGIEYHVTPQRLARRADGRYCRDYKASFAEVASIRRNDRLRVSGTRWLMEGCVTLISGIDLVSSSPGEAA